MNVISSNEPCAIVVDLDGTLVRTDLLIEGFAQLFSQDQFAAIRTLGELARGKAAFKAAIAAQADLDIASLPYNQDVLTWLEERRSEGHRLYLASAADQKLVGEIADHLGFFHGWLASEGTTNLAGDSKAARIQELLEGRPFIYLGNEAADLPIWQVAAGCVGVNCSGRIKRTLLSDANGKQPTFIGDRKGTWRSWIKLIRIKQYVKNALVAVPLLASHQFTSSNLGLTLLAIVAFSLCASSVYILNDLIDIESDRAHPTKRKRPLAAGDVPILWAVPVAVCLSIVAFGIASLIGVLFFLLLAAYFLLTFAYTLMLKRKMMVDIVTLALLYSLRILAGSAAIGVFPSEWLLGFSLFIFLSLACVKRYIELARRLDSGKQGRLANRNYDVADLSIVGSLAAASGFNAVTFQALYISSDAVRKLYPHPQFLWITCPIMIYWIGRNLLLANRRLMHDDPIVFALDDCPSIACGALIGVAAVAAAW